jgi:hypothetical protein
MSSHVTATLRGRRAVLSAVVALSVALAVTACAEEGETPDTALLAAGELEGWELAQEYPHDATLPYDQVAAAPAPDGLVWVTRAGDASGDTGGSGSGTAGTSTTAGTTSAAGAAGAAGGEDGLAVYAVSGGQEATEATLGPAGSAAVTIPVAVAADEATWAAVAVTRDQPNGGNTGLVAWRSGGGEARPAEVLAPVGEGVPAGVTVGQAGGASVVAGLVGGEVATWVSGSGGWTAGRPQLDVDGGVLNARVVGVGDRFLLAAVDTAGTPHLWSSPDGLSWTALALPDAPDGLASVGMLSALGDGEAAVGWLAGEVTGDDVPREGTAVTVQAVAADGTVADAGTIEAAPGDGVELVDVNGAVRSDGWLVVAGATIDDVGTARPAVWASANGDWARSTQDGLVDRDDHDVRALGTSGGATYGLVASRTSVDVEVWRGSDERN